MSRNADYRNRVAGDLTSKAITDPDASARETAFNKLREWLIESPIGLSGFWNELDHMKGHMKNPNFPEFSRQQVERLIRLSEAWEASCNGNLTPETAKIIGAEMPTEPRVTQAVVCPTYAL